MISKFNITNKIYLTNQRINFNYLIYLNNNAKNDNIKNILVNYIKLYNFVIHFIYINIFNLKK